MSVAVQVGIFAAGLAVGAVAVSSTSSSSNKAVPASTLPPAPAPAPALPPTAGTPVFTPTGQRNPQLSGALAAGIDNSFAVLKYGFPGPVVDVLKRKAYISGYDRAKRHPAWVAEHLTAENLKRPSLPPATPLPPTAAGSSDSAYAQALIRQQEERQQIPAVDRSNSTFKEDPEVPATFRARLEDYFRSGYDRGHLCAAADAKRSQEAMDETFLLTNIAPQVGEGFNRHYWAYVEDFCRRLTVPFSDVYVFTIPLYLPQRDVDGKWRVTYEVIGAQNGGAPSVSVPTHWAKVVLGARPSSPSTPTIQDTSIAAFVLPNAPIPDETPFESFKVPVEAVERSAGLTLFNDAVKASSKDLCRTVKCDVVVRRFDDAVKKNSRRNSVSK